VVVVPPDGRRAPTAPRALQELRLRLPAVPRLRFLLELIECALPAHAPQSGRPQLDAVALQLVYLISSGLREASAGQERRPGLIYRRARSADETEMSRRSLAKHSVLRVFPGPQLQRSYEGGWRPETGFERIY